MYCSRFMDPLTFIFLKICTNLLNRYLANISDRNLTFEAHVRELYQKLVKCTGMFRKIRYLLKASYRKIVYNAFISSRISYGSEIYVRKPIKNRQVLAVIPNKSCTLKERKHH